MFLILAQGESLGRLPDTSDQCAPPSVETFTRPSFDPTQITPAFTGDSAIANSVAPSNVMRLSVDTPPELCWCVVSFRVRSGLITFQLAPRSVVRCTNWLPAYTCVWSCGEMATGNVQFQRYFRSAGRHPYAASGHTRTLRAWRGRTSETSSPPASQPRHTTALFPLSGAPKPPSQPPLPRHQPSAMPPR